MITLIAEEQRNLDTRCYRGAAPLAELAMISQADIFDQLANPEGLQRDLNKKHAAEAYGYAAAKPNKKLPRAYPEVVLNVRNKKILTIETVLEEPVKLVRLTFDLDTILDPENGEVHVSRVDGNHRLVFAGGDGKDRKPIDLSAPFQLHVGLTRDQETNLFSTINHEQKGLNTSHLAVLRSRITPQDIELAEHPARVFAARLAEDVISPWFERVHMGGPRTFIDDAGVKQKYPYRPVSFIALEHGVNRTLRKSSYLRDTAPDVQYGLIRAFWQATAVVFPEAFEAPRDYLIAKNIGVQAFSEVAAMVIDRCLIAHKIEVGHMIPFLEAARGTVDWHKDSKDVAGMSGNRAALLLSQAMSAELPTVAEAYVEVPATAA